MKENNNWIPVSERLPDYDSYDEIIATVDGEHCGVQYINAVVTDVYFEDGEWFMYGLKMENLKVLAWQPLPEPWRGEENETRIADKRTQKSERRTGYKWLL